MVAVVSGNGLGLFNTSLTGLGGLQGGPAGLGGRAGAQVVNISNGNLILQDQDENLTVRGFNAGVLRTYNSRGTVSGVGQDGFVTGYERRVALTSGTLNVAASQMTLTAGDGQTQIFTYSSANTYVSTAGDGAHDTLVWNSGTSTWTMTEGSSRREEQYANHADTGLLGRLTVIRDLKSSGTAPAQFDVIYSDNTASARITEIRSIDDQATTTLRDAILFGYDGSNRLASITTREGGVTKSQVSYGYDTQSRLSWVQQDLTPTITGDATWDAVTAANNNGLRFRTNYTYVTTTASDLRIASVTQSDGATVSYTYEADGAGGHRVKTVTQGSSSDGSAQTVTFTYNTNSTDVVDSLNRTWTYQYDANKQLTAILAPTVSGQRDTTTYTYDTSGNVTQVKTVSGSTTLSQTDQSFDGNGNVLWQWMRVDGAIGNASSIAVQRTYSSTNQLLTETRYTGLDADGIGAGMPTGTALTSNFIYDEQNRLRFSVDATGAVTERTYASSGNGIGQLTSTRVYFGANYASTMTELALATWATTTLKATSQLTEFVYDVKGRLQQSVSFASVDQSTGVGVTTDVANDITSYNYDAQGLLLQKIVVRGAARTTTYTATPSNTSEVSSYVYDGMGRLLSVLQRDIASAVTDALSVSTTYSYTDSAKQIAVTLDSGAIRTETRNLAGQTTTIAQAASGQTTRTTQNFFDAAGQLRGSQDASGARRYFFYDAKGRLEAEVDATGAVTKYNYDGADRRLSTLQYANRVTTTSWLSGSTVSTTKLIYQTTAPTLNAGEAWLQTDSANDRTSVNTFDAAGRVLTTTDAAGGTDRQITSYTYDGAGRLTLISTTDSVGTTATARITRQFYDNAGRLIATLDAERYLVRTTYDAAGRIIQTTRSAGKIVTPATIDATTLLSALTIPVDAMNDQTTRYFYNGRGQTIGTLDALGYLTEAIVDEAGNTRAERRYAKQLTGLTGTETFAALKTLATTAAPVEQYRESKSAYNGLGQLITQTNYEGTATKFTYDEAGRLVRTQAAENTSEVREGFKRYNVFDELIGEITGQQADEAYVSLGNKLLTDPSLLPGQLDTAYAKYGMTHSYDALSRRIESIGPRGIDAQGDKTFYFYDSQGRQTFTVKGVAQDNAGVAAAKNAYGEVTETRYSAFGQVIDSLTYTGRIAIGVPGDRTSVQSAIGVLNFVAATDTRRQFMYDQRGLLKQSIDALGINSTYNYTAFGQLNQEFRANSTPAAVTIQHNYDKRGLETSRTDASGNSLARTSSQTYDAFGRVVTSTDARGVITNVTYDRLGRQLTRSLNVTSEGTLRTETYTTAYDSYSRTTQLTDALGNITSYVYSDTNRSMTVTTQELVSITTVHNRHGQTLTVSQVLPDTTTATSTNTYDKNGALLTSTNPLNQVSGNSYDVRGLLYESTDASGRKVRYTYDAVGRVLSRSDDPAGLNLITTTSFDGQGRQVKVTDATGRITTMSYDQEGRLLQTAQDPPGLNLRTSYTYDALGRQVTVTEGFGTTAARTTQYVYDVLGRRTQERVDPTGLNLTTNYLYDANDNVVQRTDATGNVSRFVYDEANRRIYDIDASGGVSKTTYDKDGRIVAVRNYATAITVSDLSTTAGATAATIKTRVDAIANEAIDQISYRVYDRDSRMRFSITNISSTSASVTEMRYDSAGRASQSLAYVAAFTDTTVLAKIKAGTAVFTDFGTYVAANEATAQRQSQVYDAAGRLRFSVDALGNVTEQRYDAAGRTVQSLAYAAALTDTILLGKIKVGTATVAEFNTFITANDATVQRQSQVYDAAGRLRFSIDALGGVTEQRYDAAGRVTETLRYTTTVALSAALKTKLQTGDITALTDINALLVMRTTLVWDSGFDTNAFTGFNNNTWVFPAYANGEAVFERNPGVSTGVAPIIVSNTRSYLNEGLTYSSEIRIGGSLAGSYFAMGIQNEATYQSTSFLRDAISIENGVLQRSQYSGALETKTALMNLSLNTTYIVETETAADYVTTFVYAKGSDRSSGVSFTRQTDSVTYGKTLWYAHGLQQPGVTGGTVYLDNVSATVRQNPQQQSIVYDAAGRAKYIIDASGAVTEQRYDAAGRVTQTLRYTQAITLSPALKTKLQTGDATALADINALLKLPTAVTWASTVDTSAFTGFVNLGMNFPLFNNGEAEFKRDPSVTAVRAQALVGETRSYLSDALTYSSEIRVSGSLSGSMLLMGLQNEADYLSASFLRDAIYVDNGVLYKHQITGATVTKTALMTLTLNTTYIVETETTSDYITTYVYVKGSDRSTGVSYTRQTDSISYGRTMWYAYNDQTPGVSGGSVFLDNVSASVRQNPQQQSIVYDAAGRAKYIIDASGAVTEQRYDAAGRVTETLRYTTTVALSAALKTKLQTGDATALADITALLVARMTLSFDSGFDGNSLSGFVSSAGIAPTMSNGRVVFDRNPAVSGSYAYPVIVSSGRYTLSQGLTFAAEFSTDGNLTNNSMELGLNNEIAWLQPGYRREGISVQNGKLYRRQINGSDNQNVEVMTLSANTTYVVEIETQDGLVTTYVYAKGSDRSQGINFSANSSSASFGSSYWYAAGLHLPGVSGGSITLDNVSAITRQNAQIQANRYDAAGRLVRSFDALGNVTEYGYDAAGRRISVTDARGFTSYVVYDSAGRAKYSIDALGTVSESKFDAAGRVIAPRTYASAITINSTLLGKLANGNATLSDISALLTVDNTRDRQSYVVYDNADRQRFSIDASGVVTETRYDATSRVLKNLVYATPLLGTELAAVLAGTATLSTFTSFVTINAAAARTSTQVYDAAGQLLSKTDALNGVESYSYNSVGQVVTRTNKLGFVWTYIYDAAGRQVEERSPQVSVLRYDANGVLLPAVIESLVTRIVYDATGNVISRTEAFGTAEARTTRYLYDSRGLQIKTIFPEAGSLNASNQLTFTGAQPSIEVTYDAVGQAVVQKDVRGNYSYKIYDIRGRVAFDVDAEGFVTAYMYDATGEQTGLRRYATKINTSGLSGWTAGTTLSLAQMNTTSVLIGNDVGNRTLVTTYDALGRKTKVTQPSISYVKADGTLTTGSPQTVFTYNSFGEVIQEALLLEGMPGQSDAKWANISYFYDVLGRRTQTVDAAGYLTSISYNALGEVASSTEYARALTSGSWNLSTAPAAPVAGDATTGYDRTVSYNYDALGRQVLEHTVRHAQDVNGIMYLDTVDTASEYDAESRQTATVVEGQRTETSFDALGRTIAVKEAARSVLVANWQTQLQSNAALNLASAGLYRTVNPYTTMGYDAFGNVIQTTRFADGWQAGGPFANATQDQSSLARYDRQGRLIVDTDAEGIKRYRQYNEADQVTSSWYDLNTGSGNIWRVASSFAYDKNGQQITTKVTRQQLVTNVLTGAVLDDQRIQVRYNAFGETIAKGNDLNLNLATSGLSEQVTYDAAGRIVTTNSETGSIRTYGYNLAGHQLKEIRKAYLDTANTNVDVVTTNTVDILGRTTRQVLPAYNAAQQTSSVVKVYDRWGNALESIDPRGYSTRYEFNELNQATREIQPLAKNVSETGMQSWIHPEQRWFYDGLGRLVGMKDPNGNVHKQILDTSGRQIKSLDAFGTPMLYGYDNLGRQVAKQDALGYLTYDQYDRLNRATATGDFLLNTAGNARSQNARQSYLLDENGSRIRVTDALTYAAKFDFDSQQRILRSQSAAGAVQSFGYDVQGNKILETTAVGDQQSWAYNYFGLQIDQIDLGGNNSDFYLAASGQLMRQTSNATATGNTAGVWGNLEALLFSMQYLTAQTQDRSYSYFANGMIREVRDLNGGIYTYQYDANGNRTMEETKTVDGRGTALQVRTRIVYDSHNRIERVINDDLLSGIRTLDVRFSYDAAGNRRRVVAQSGYTPDQSSPISTQNQAAVATAAPNNIVILAGEQTRFYYRANELFTDPDGDKLTYSVRLQGGGTLPAWLNMATDSIRGELVFTSDVNSLAATGSNYTVEIVATDTGSGLQTVTAFNLAVSSNNAPVSTVAGALTWKLKTDRAWSMEINLADYFSDADIADSLTLDVFTRPSWMQYERIDAGKIRLSGTPTSTNIGDFVVVLTATDRFGKIAAKPVSVQVTAPIVPLANTLMPSFITIGNAFFYERNLDDLFDARGSRIVSVSAILSDGRPVPAWMSMESFGSDGSDMFRLFGDVPSDIAAGTSYSISITATTEDGLSATANLQVTANAVQINGGPTYGSINGAPLLAISMPMGQSTSYTIPDSLIYDSNGDPLQFQLVSKIPPMLDVFSPYQQDFSMPALPTWLQFDAAHRRISVNPPVTTSNQELNYYLVASDPWGATTVLPITISITGGNGIPQQIEPINLPAVVVNQAWTYTIPATAFADPEAGALSYSVQAYSDYLNILGALPSWLTFNPTTRVLSGTLPSNFLGLTSHLDFTVTDSLGASRTVRAPLSQNSSNLPPVVATAIPSQSALPTSGWTYQFPANTFSDPEAKTLAYTATLSSGSALPSGLTFTAATRTFTFGAIPPTAGVYVIRVKATDPSGAWVTNDFNLVVNPAGTNPPVSVYPVPDQNVKQGTAWTYALPTYLFTDPENGAIAYTATLDTGAALPTTWLNFNTVTKTFTATTGAPVGTYKIRVTAKDPTNAVAVSNFTITVVSSTTDTPVSVVNPVQNQTVAQLSPWSFQLPANIFLDIENQALQYSVFESNNVQLNGGYGYTFGLPQWLTYNAATKTFTGTPPTAGTYVITVMASTGGYSTPAFSTFKLVVTPPASNPAPVANAISNQTNLVGTAWTFDVPAGTFTDPQGQALTYSARLSNTYVLPEWIKFDAVTRRFTGTAPTAGSWTFAVTATDPYGVSASTNFTYTASTASNLAPVANITVPTQNGEYNSLFVYTLPINAFTDPNGTSLIYSASTLPSWLNFDANSKTLYGTPPSSTTSYGVTLRATDALGAYASVSFNVSIQPQAQPGTNPGTSAYAGVQVASGLSGQTNTAATTTGPVAEQYWFTYDAENRAQIVNGQLVNGQVSVKDSDYPWSFYDSPATNQALVRKPSFELRYDAVGRVVAEISYSPLSPGSGSFLWNVSRRIQHSIYTQRGELSATFTTQSTYETGSIAGVANSPTILWGGVNERRFYDADGRLIEVRDYFTRHEEIPSTNQDTAATAGQSYIGWLQRAQTITYNTDGQVTVQQTYGRSSATWFNDAVVAEGSNPLAMLSHQSTDRSVLDLLTTTTNTVRGDGMLSQSVFQNFAWEAGTRPKDGFGAWAAANSFTHSYSYTYLKRQAYLEKDVSASSNDTLYQPATTTSMYDAYGRRIAVKEHVKDAVQDVVRYFAYDQNDGILSRRDGWLTSNNFTQDAPDGFVDTAAKIKERNLRFVHASGQQVAKLSQAGEIDILSRLTAYDAGSSSQGYIVQAGDTLQSIAQRVYGNSGLWYVIAEANAIQSDAKLVVGSHLRTPEVKVSSNDSNTFKPYDINEIVGSTTPTMPYVLPPPCQNGMMIVMIVVIIIVTIATYGTMTAPATEAGVAATAAATTATTATTVGTAAGAGTAGAAGGGAAAAGAAVNYGAAFVAGMAGNAAGQVFANIAGLQNGFSVKQMIAGGLKNMLTMGIAQGLGVSSAPNLSWSNVASYAASGALSAAAGYAVDRGLGLQTKFSWKSIAASTVSSVVGAGINTALKGVNLPGGAMGGSFIRSAAGGLVSAHINRALGLTDKIDGVSIAGDAFGNALATGVQIEMERQRAVNQQAQPQITRIADIEQTQMSDVEDLIQNIEPMDFSGLQLEEEAVVAASKTKRAIAQENVSATHSVSAPSSVRPNGNLTVDNLVDTIDQISAASRQPYTNGVRVFDRDAIRMQFSINGLGGMNEHDFAQHEEMVARLRNAEATLPGDAQLLVAFKPGMSKQAMLADSIRIGGGYMGVQSGFNLLKQINSGANVIDLTYVRADSEAYLDYKMQSPELHAARMQKAVIDARRVSTVSPYNDQENQLRRNDSLMPGRLKITEKGVMREVNRAIMKANLASLAVDVAGMGLFMGIRATSTKGVLSGLAADGLTLNRTTLRGLAKDLRPSLERMRASGLAGKGPLSVPQGLTTEQFASMSEIVRTQASKIGLGGDISVHGSRAAGTARATSDIDIAIRLSPEEFDEFLYTKSRLRTVNPGSSKADTLRYSIENGIIQRGEARLSPLGKQLEAQFGFEVDISVVRIGGNFDTGPFIPLMRPLPRN